MKKCSQLSSRGLRGALTAAFALPSYLTMLSLLPITEHYLDEGLPPPKLSEWGNNRPASYVTHDAIFWGVTTLIFLISLIR